MRLYFFASLISCSLLAIGFLTELIPMDNASEDFVHIVYYGFLLIVALVGNIALVTKGAGEQVNVVVFSDCLIASLNIITGIFSLIWFNEAFFSWFSMLAILAFLFGVLGVIRTVLKINKVL